MPKGFKINPITGEQVRAWEKLNVDYEAMLLQYYDHIKQGVYVIPFKYAEIKGLNPAQCSYFANEFLNKHNDFWEKCLELKRKYYHQTSILVDEALITKCKDGDPRAIDLYYQKIEGWRKEQVQLPVTINLIFGDGMVSEDEKNIIDLKQVETPEIVEDKSETPLFIETK